MKVFILEKGQDHEGGRIVGVFQTLNLAKQAAQDVMQKASYNEWNPVGDGHWWHRGCGWLTIKVLGGSIVNMVFICCPCDWLKKGLETGFS